MKEEKSSYDIMNPFVCLFVCLFVLFAFLLACLVVSMMDRPTFAVAVR